MVNRQTFLLALGAVISLAAVQPAEATVLVEFDAAAAGAGIDPTGVAPAWSLSGVPMVNNGTFLLQDNTGDDPLTQSGEYLSPSAGAGTMQRTSGNYGIEFRTRPLSDVPFFGGSHFANLYVTWSDDEFNFNVTIDQDTDDGGAGTTGGIKYGQNSLADAVTGIDWSSPHTIFVGYRSAAETFDFYVDDTAMGSVGYGSIARSGNYAKDAVGFGDGTTGQGLDVANEWYSVRIHDAPIPPGLVLTPGSWAFDQPGNWNVASNWGDNTVPDAADAPALFLGAIATTRTIFTDADVTVGTVRFDNANAYVIAGAGSVSLDVAAGNALIDVDSGDHQFQAVVNLNDETDADVSAGASISFNNALNLNGNNLNTPGAGTVNINNQINTGGGQVNVPAGVLGGSGEVGGNLNVTGGTVAPGNSAGTLSVEGNATFDNSSTLDVEIESLADFDVLAVTGNAVLDGTLNISLLGGYTPTNGDMFTILTGASVTDNGLTLTGASGFSLANSGTALTLTFGGLNLLLGDADNSGTVTADDLIAVQQNFGNVGPNGDGTDLGDANDDGVVTADDLISVQQNFGNTLGASGGAAVPEPATAILLVIGALAVARRGRRGKDRS